MYAQFRLVMLCVTVALSLSISSAPAAAVSDRLPDLGMAPLRDIRIEKTAEGRRLLRFTTEMANVGPGPFEARGQRPDTASPTMTTSQRIYNDAGAYRDVPTVAE